MYHVRKYDVFRLAKVCPSAAYWCACDRADAGGGRCELSPPDMFASHDWPNTIERHGDAAGLRRRKPFFRAEVGQGTRGCAR